MKEIKMGNITFQLVSIVDDVDYKYFPRHPNPGPDAPDKADGCYFKLPNAENWVGPFEDYDAASGAASLALHSNEDFVIKDAFAKKGFLCVIDSEHHYKFVQKYEDSWVIVDLIEDCVVAKRQMLDEKGRVSGSMFDIAFEEFNPHALIVGVKYQAVGAILQSCNELNLSAPKL